ncbi:PAS domain-containing protein [Methanobacterium ferruginis]|uniref:PAS domain-containing protein n=1 Tax=Methanobacterium ferruginis TaxID=710191 RepID=UPI002573F185|nr:PAS domain S-box protein [Methanobacterium ferruginis]
MTEQNIHNKDSDKIALLKKEIEDLKKQLALKNQIFEISPNYLLLLGLKGEILKVNNSVRNVFFDGKTDDIPPQFSQLKIIPSKDFHKYTDSVNSILNGLPNKPFKSKFLFANNEPGDGFRYIKVYISPVKSHKKITAISIFANDITDDGSLENSLEKTTLISADKTLIDNNPETPTTDLTSTKDTGESENYYKTIFENSTTATILVEEDNVISLVNSETENIFGYKPEEVMGQKTWLEFVTPDYRAQMIEYQKLRQDNTEMVPDQYEFCLVDKNGEFKDIFAKICLIPGTKKTLASIMDVTEENKALNKILESETMYRTLAEALEEFVFIFDREDRLEYINKYAADKLDVKPSQVLGKQRKDLVTKKLTNYSVKILKEYLKKEIHSDRKTCFTMKISPYG